MTINNLFTVKRPVCIREKSGDKSIAIIFFPHTQGLLIFKPYWHLDKNNIELIQGEITGTGPWKIKDKVITLVGCHGSDPDLAMQLSEWESYLMINGDEYPDGFAIKQIAKEYGAIV